MNKADKRQRSIRNKLMAAVAMLLVASIMTVTTTYAWFTLSTAPEVQGITTTVGANGNLEIALSPVDGDYSKITSNVGDADIQSWVAKNLTWGNLLDLSDASYRLDELTLLPSRLNINEGTETTANTLAGSPLKVPVYGSDGRISTLSGDKVTMGTYDTVGAASGFMANSNYGVRAVGTSSTMSPNLIAYNNALAALSSGSTRANSTVTNALNTYGAVLADMAVKHASVGDGEDNNDYVAYVDELRAISDALVSAADDVEEALYNALLALAKSTAGATIQIAGQDAYTYLKTNMESGTPLETIWGAGDLTALLGSSSVTSVLTEAYDVWEGLNTDVQTNKTNVYALKTADTAATDVSWTEVSNAMSVMLDTGKITISGYTMDKVMENIVEIMGTAGGVRLELGAGTGVIADFGELTGDILSSVQLSDGLTYTTGGNTIKLGGLPVKIVTTSEPDEGALLTQCRAVILQLGVAESEGDSETATLIDVIYSYMIDFVFRTNAANSSLLLQTDAAQRIYGDSTSLSTMGGGSTITFSDTFLNLDSLVSMMSGIRVVFTDTKGDEVYGVAKVHFDEHLMKLNLMSVERTLVDDNKETTDSETGVTTVVYGKDIEYTEAAAVETNVLLSADNEGNVTLNVQLGTDATTQGALYLGDHQYLVREKITEEDSAGVESTYERWTVKTAVTYTVTETVTTKTPAVTDASGAVTTPEKEEAGTAQTVTYELTDAEGNVIFYDHKDIDGDGDADYYLNEDAAKAVTVITGKLGANDTTMTDDQDSVHVYYTDLAALIDTSDAVGAYPAEADENGVFTKVDKVYKDAAAYATDIQTGHAEPKYFHVDDQAVTLEGPLHMYDYSVDDKGELVFTAPLNEQTITTLDQNVPTGITAMVYLDGDYVDNSDVTNSADGVANSGALNLQFASSANLVPMENSDLKNSKDYEVKFENTAGATVLAPKEYATEGQDFLFALNQDYTVTYTVTDSTGTVSAAKTLTGKQETAYGMTGWSYTVPGADIKGTVTITIAPKT